MSNIAIALAHELGTHIDDLVDEGATRLEMPDAGGETVGRLLDTSLVDGGLVNDNSFIALVIDAAGNQIRVRVTCEVIGKECSACPYVAMDQQGLDDHIEAAEHDQDFTGEAPPPGEIEQVHEGSFLAYLMGEER